MRLERTRPWWQSKFDLTEKELRGTMAILTFPEVGCVLAILIAPFYGVYLILRVAIRNRFWLAKRR